MTDGRTALGAQGYIAERELLAGHWSACQAVTPGWRADVLGLTVPLAEFCAANNHRAPWDFPPGVWERATAYLTAFPAPSRA